MSQSDMQIDAVRWRDRLLALGGLTAVIALSWLYLVRMNAGMSHGHLAEVAIGLSFCQGVFTRPRPKADARQRRPVPYQATTS